MSLAIVENGILNDGIALLYKRNPQILTIFSYWCEKYNVLTGIIILPQSGYTAINWSLEE